MAKKTKLPSKLLLAGIGGGAVAAVLVAVFVFGVGFNVAPLSSNIPQSIPEAEFFPPDVIDVDPIQIPPDLTDDEIANLPINEGATPGEVPNPEITSDNSTLVQVIEKIIQPESVSLTSLITKIDTNGIKTFKTESIALSPLSFFVEDISNIDYSKGFIEIQGKTLTNNASSLIDGTAIFDVLINNQTVLTGDPIMLKVNGKGCSIGCPVPDVVCQDDACRFSTDSSSVFAKFVTSSGIESPTFTFSFAEHLDKFTPNGKSVLEFVLRDANFKLESGKLFGSSKLVLYTMDIARDPNQVIITDEGGITQRMYPQDSTIYFYNAGDSYHDCCQCRSYNIRESGTVSLYLVESVPGGYSKDTLIMDGAPLTVGNTYGTSCGAYYFGGPALFRNQEYRLVHYLSPTSTGTAPSTNFDIKFTTPKTQVNVASGCYWGAGYLVRCYYPSPDSSKLLYIPP